MRNLATRDTVPCAYITKGRQRIKQFNKSVYLNNGDEFEIELFNPTSGKILAGIDINGKSTGAGIVLRPGERVFLERYIDTARKFLFETYEVSGNNTDVQRAIAQNGSITVKFFNEYINPWPTVDYNVPTFDWTYRDYDATPRFDLRTKLSKSVNNDLGRGIVGAPSARGTGISNSVPLSENNAFYSSAVGSAVTNDSLKSMDTTYTTASLNFVDMESTFKSPGISTKEVDNSKIETGRVEKGSHSNQSFQYDNTTFNTYYSWISEWKILPISQKPITSEDLNAYWCGNCGARKGKGAFCQFCGANNWVVKNR